MPVGCLALLRLRYQKEVSFPLKRFLCVVLVAALMVFFAACGSDLLSSEPEATAAPTASSNVRSEPVKVTETYANADNVTDSQAESEPQTTETVETPETGDFPVVYFAGVLGLILICSAGLLMLRRI